MHYVGVGTCSLTASVSNGTNYARGDRLGADLCHRPGEPGEPHPHLDERHLRLAAHPRHERWLGERHRQLRRRQRLGELHRHHLLAHRCRSGNLSRDRDEGRRHRLPCRLLRGDDGDLRSGEPGEPHPHLDERYLRLAAHPSPTSGGSGSGAVSYVVGNGTVTCTLTGSSLSVTAPGSCLVTATKAADTDYVAASSATTTVTFQATPQTITITSTAPIAATFGSATYAVTAASSSALPVALSIDSSSSDGLLHLGRRRQLHDLGYLHRRCQPGRQRRLGAGASSPAALHHRAGRAEPLDHLVSSRLGGGRLGHLHRRGELDVGSHRRPHDRRFLLPVCSISAAVVSFTATGTCVLDTNQPGDARYAAAGQVQQRFSVLAGGELLQSSPLAAAVMVGSGYTGQLTVSGARGAVTYTETSGTAPAVSSSGSLSGSSSLAVGSYSVSGSAQDASGDVGLWTFTLVVSPTNAPPPASVAGVTFGEPASVATTTNTISTVAQTTTGVSEALWIPAGAFPLGTTVSVYPVSSPTTFASSLLSGQSYLASFTVSWQEPNGSHADTTVPVVFTITDPSIVAGDVVDEVTAGGVRAVGVATVDGVVTISFTNDPTFILARTPHLRPIGTARRVGPNRIDLSLSCSAGVRCRGSRALHRRRGPQGSWHHPRRAHGGCERRDFGRGRQERPRRPLCDRGGEKAARPPPRPAAVSRESAERGTRCRPECAAGVDRLGLSRAGGGLCRRGEGPRPAAQLVSSLA